jgi:L-ribulokinase
MGRATREAYRPVPARVKAYDALYTEYLRLHDYFGRDEAHGGNAVLHRLRAIRNKARG